MAHINIIEIPTLKGTYEGYLWLSNESTPRVLNNESLPEELFKGINPFIVEGQLYDAEKGLSVSIRFVGGQHLCQKFEVKSEDFNPQKVDSITFEAHRIEGKKYLKFLRYWSETKDVDNACLGMPTLTQEKLVFVGFTEK